MDAKLLRIRDRICKQLPLFPDECAIETPDDRQEFISRVYFAIEAERRRNLSGHYAYDLARHAALFCAWTDLRAWVLAHDCAGVS